MVDPLASLLIRQLDQSTQNDIPTDISVEEAIDCRNSNSRFFSLLNHESRLKIIINDNSTMASCKLDGNEIVIDRNLYQESHETWAIGDRPYQKLSSLSWNSHVRGSELILSSCTSSSSSSPHTSLHYELTRSNELNCVAKMKTIHLQHQVFYLNLNKATDERRLIDGHRIAVRCNGNMNRIEVQQTRLLCQCNKTARTSPRSFIGDIPSELVHDPEDPSSDNLIICDAIFSLESTCSLDYLQTRLQFENRVVEFEVRSIRSMNLGSNQSSAVNSNSNNNVSSSTHKFIKSIQTDLKQMYLPDVSSDPNRTQFPCSSRHEEQIASSSSAEPGDQFKRESFDATSSGTQSHLGAKGQTTNSQSPTLHPSTMLRIRVRVTNFGVCIMPIMMINYTYRYRFIW